MKASVTIQQTEHLFLITGSEASAHVESQAVVKSEGKVCDEAVKRRGGSDLGQGRIAQQMACDGSVRQIVKLLQEVSQKQWQGKGEKQLHGASLCHVQRPSRRFCVFHSDLLFSIILL